MDGATSVFSIEDVLTYGEPCYYGFVDYIVLSTLDYERPLRTDYKFEQDRERVRAVHRYDRVKRFEWVLYQILGYRGELPEEVVELCTGCVRRMINPKLRLGFKKYTHLGKYTGYTEEEWIETVL